VQQLRRVKKAAVFKSKQGIAIYVLYEESYSKNVIPHTPRWSCISIGPLEEAMKAIFHQAGACEGGSLRSRTGDLKPENYIAPRRLSELASPVVQEDSTVSMSIGVQARTPLFHRPVAGGVRHAQCV
jgi:hypothetical protein